MVTDSSLEMRLARREDLERIGLLLPELAGTLFSERFPGGTVADFYQWKYFANPIGEAAVGIAVTGQRVVSIAAAVPKLIQVGSETLPTFELGDFITAADYRNRGLFSRLIEMICGEVARRTAAFVYVRPNSVSFPILAKGLSFLEVRQIDERRYIVPSGLIHRRTGIPAGLLRTLGIDWAARRMFVPSSSDSVKVSKVTRFDKDMDEFWENTRLRYTFSVVRDSRYLNWRYVDCPTPYLLWTAYRSGRVAGYLAGFMSRTERSGYLLDLFTDFEDTDAAAALAREGIDTMLAAGAQSIFTWTLRPGAKSASARLLRRACPAASRQHLHLAMRFFDGRFEASSLPSSGWQLATGDFDGV